MQTSNRYFRRLTLTATLIVFALVPAACDSGGGDSGVDAALPSGSVTIGPKQGVDFETGLQTDPGTFANSDVYAAENGGALNLLAGGETSAKTRAVDWNVLGGVPQTFASLAEVPSSPLPTTFGTLVNAETGNGGIILNAAGSYTKVWIASATATSVTLQFEPLE